MADPAFPAFQIFSFLGFLLVLVPLPWHLQASNGGTCLYMIWVSLGCLNLFVNSVVWHNNTDNIAPVWCDISSRFIVGIATAIPAVSLVINRRLYKIATMKTASFSIFQKRRALVEDLSIGIGLPVLQMIFQIIVSGHRFNILEDIGCYPFTYNTWLAIPLVTAWPLLIGLVSAVYCVLSISTFLKRRAQMSDVLSAQGSLTTSRYFRLMCLASTELILNTPISAYGLYLNITTTPMNPYKGWADTHFHYSKVDRIPAVLWRSTTETTATFELGRWAVPFCAFVFFALFGFAEEARRNYRLAYVYIIKRLDDTRWKMSSTFERFRFDEKSSPIPANASFGSLPLYIPCQPPPIHTASIAETGSISSRCSSATIVDGKTPTSKMHIDLDSNSFRPFDLNQTTSYSATSPSYPPFIDSYYTSFPESVSESSFSVSPFAPSVLKR